MVPVDVADLSACLPPAKVLELVRLNQELEMAVHEAHAANAAVAAVAQVLASKQAAALRSREVASAATKRLRRFMAELDTQVGAGAGSSPLVLKRLLGGPAAGSALQQALHTLACCTRVPTTCTGPLDWLPGSSPSPSLLMQFGIQSKLGAGKRPPLSPTKPAGLASPSVLPSAAPLSPAVPVPPPQLPVAPALDGCSL